jgi:hypothetical protein
MKKSNVAAQERADTTDASTAKPSSKNRITNKRGSGTTDESPPENVEADSDLAALIEQHEDTDWSDMPGISAAEAGAWTAHLIKARKTVQEGL